MENIFSQLAHLLEEELNNYVKVQDQFSVKNYVKGEMMRAANRAQQEEIEGDLLDKVYNLDKGYNQEQIVPKNVTEMPIFKNLYGKGGILTEEEKREIIDEDLKMDAMEAEMSEPVPPPSDEDHINTLSQD